MTIKKFLILKYISGKNIYQIKLFMINDIDCLIKCDLVDSGNYEYTLTSKGVKLINKITKSILWKKNISC